MRKSVHSMVGEAMAAIRTWSVEEAQNLHGRDDVQFVDVRDVRELEREGVIPGAFHAPRGMLEFWVDPESPWHKPVFGEDKQFVLFCAIGWRSALATKTLQDMGIENVSHIDGGFVAWKEAGAPVADKPPRAKKRRLMDLLQHLRAQARANRLANRRLHGAMRTLTREEFHAPRVSFFPSLAATLNHILLNDVYYLDALHGVPEMAANADAFVPADTLDELMRRQESSDVRLIAYCDAMTAASLETEVAIDRR